MALTLGKKSSNNLSLVGYGYDKKNYYLNQDIGNLRLKIARGKHKKIKADDVKIFYYSVPKECKFIGYITLENPKGLNFPSIGGLGKFDTESFEFKYLKKAASVNGVKNISYVQTWRPVIKKKNGYIVGYYGDVIRVFSDQKEQSRYLRVSVKAYDCTKN